jgi:IS5 family transposase
MRTDGRRRGFVARDWRGVHGQIEKELRRRAAIEPVTGHLKSDGHLGRNYLNGRHGGSSSISNDIG